MSEEAGGLDLSERTQDGAVPLVEMRGIVKRFGDFVANDHVSISLRAGEIHALLGENGAGKSTLVKILYGLLQPSEGDILWQGVPIVLEGPVAARDRGIGMVFQHFSLFENLTVGENIAAAMPATLSFAEIDRRIAQVEQEFGIAVDAKRPVWSLSAGERQRIEIVRCLLQHPKLIVLDEPTSVLTPQEAERLFETLERLRDAGTAILYISHRLDDVRRLASIATVLRLGKVVGTMDPRAATAREIAAMMVGADVGEVHHREGSTAEPLLVVEGLSHAPYSLHGVALKDVSLAVRSGEIVGIAGIAGNGQSELFAALSGETLGAPSSIALCGRPAGALGINARRRLGGAFVAEERLGHGAVPSHSLSDNILLTHHADEGATRGGFISGAMARRLADEVRRAFDVRAGKGDPAASTLSGGNLQKFVVGRELLREPRVLVVNQPSWGVDAAAAVLIRQSIVDAAEKGTAVLVISQDLDELFEMADRIAVIHDGHLTEPRRTRSLTREAIGFAMTGSAGARDAFHAA